VNLRFVTKSNCVCMCALYHSRQQEELGQLQAELHDAESADDGIYGALRAQDRGAAVDTTATQGLGPHGKSAVQLRLSALGLTPDCDAGVRMTGKFDSAESWEDPSRRDDKYLDQFLKQTALQDQIKGLQDKCRALREEVEVAQRAVQEVPALVALMESYNSTSPPQYPSGKCVPHQAQAPKISVLNPISCLMPSSSPRAQRSWVTTPATWSSYLGHGCTG